MIIIIDFFLFHYKICQTWLKNYMMTASNTSLSQCDHLKVTSTCCSQMIKAMCQSDRGNLQGYQQHQNQSKNQYRNQMKCSDLTILAVMLHFCIWQARSIEESNEDRKRKQLQMQDIGDSGIRNSDPSRICFCYPIFVWPHSRGQTGATKSSSVSNR